MLSKAWALARNTVEGFIADEAMTRGAAIACYAMFSIAPLLVVAVAIAGLAFGEEAVRGAVAEQLRALVGREGAEAVQAMERGVGEGGGPSSTGVPALVSIGVLLGERQRRLRRAAGRAERDLEGGAAGGHAVLPAAGAGAEHRPGGGHRLPAAGLAAGQRRAGRALDLGERSAAGRSGAARGAGLPGLL